MGASDYKKSVPADRDPAALDRRVDELSQENEALRRALEAAEEANRAKSRFLSSMSHDIRTPMNAIMGMTAIVVSLCHKPFLLSHIDEKARVQDCLDKIRTASTHLMSLVNDVLDMSRIDSGRMTLNQERFSLADLTHDIAVIVRPQAAQKEQTLRFEIGKIHEESLTGDPLRLRHNPRSLFPAARPGGGRGLAGLPLRGQRHRHEQ